VTEVRPITSRLYGSRVQRHHIARLKKLAGLHQANPKSDLFCIEVSGMDNSPSGALKRFRELVAQAGLGDYFGISPEGALK
jgi:hypothetical protein